MNAPSDLRGHLRSRKGEGLLNVGGLTFGRRRLGDGRSSDFLL
jgi:hypothetical protein